jgi:MFS family permease
MITPLLPVFLAATLGAGPAIISLIEGVAEATSSLFKVWSGRLVDRGVPARSLVIGGYAVSVTSRPWIGLAGIAIGWPIVMALRFLDRVGKGLRTSPRDALIADVVPEGGRGRAYGLHRAMDHTGAVIGPLLAAGLLAAHVPLRDVFLWAMLPGALVVLLLWFGLPQGSTVPPEAVKQASASPGLLATWHALTPDVRRLVIGGGLLAVAAVPEVMLVLWATAAGMPVAMVPLMWAAASLAKMAVAYPAGWAVDRFGVRKVLAVGWSARVVMLVVMAMADYGAWLALWLILAYSVTISGTEAAERAWIGNGTKQGLRGRAFGGYHMAVGLAALPGAAAFGLLWQFRGAPFALCSAATLTALTALVLLRRAPR